MPKQIQSDNNKAQREGDTSRTSNQGRKLASGGNPNKKGTPEIEEVTKTPVTELKKAIRQTVKAKK